MILDDRLRAGATIVLDGATGTEIARLGGAMNGAAWCAVANTTHPDIVRRVHEDYIRAGADVVTTNTFATCRHVLAGAGLADDTAAINRRAVELALEARDRAAAARPVAVAGSMSTTFAWTAGTTRPDPAFMPERDEETANYHEMAGILADAGVDLLIMEMMEDLDHAVRCVDAAVATGLPVWVGINCALRSDGSLVGGEASRADDPGRPPLTTLIDALMAQGADVYGIMHSTVAATGPALDCLMERWKGPVMAYPESLGTFDTGTHLATQADLPEEFAGSCLDWQSMGVQIVGGCCGTTIEHIRALVGRLPPPHDASGFIDAGPSG